LCHENKTFVVVINIKDEWKVFVFGLWTQKLFKVLKSSILKNQTQGHPPHRHKYIKGLKQTYKEAEFYANIFEAKIIK